MCHDEGNFIVFSFYFELYTYLNLCFNEGNVFILFSSMCVFYLYQDESNLTLSFFLVICVRFLICVMRKGI